MSIGQAVLMDYSNEVPHSELLIVRGKEPFNAEPKASALVEFSITPDELVYCRNHGPVEDLDRDAYLFTVAETPQGDVKYTMHDLATKFTTYRVVAALQVSPQACGSSGLERSKALLSAQATDERR